MIWNTIPDDERLRLWKKLRQDITLLPMEQQLNEVAKFCASMPFGARTLDYYSTEFWPTPWEILFHGSFCTSSISLLMFYTFILLDTTFPIELHLVEDDTGLFLLPIIDNHFVLNFELGAVNKCSEVNDKFKTTKIYTRSDVKIT